MTRKQRKVSVLRRNHRTIGVVAAVFVIFMVISGLLLNHSNDLGLDKRHVSRPLVLDWYGLGGPEQIYSFVVGDEWLSIAGSQIYLNDRNAATLASGVGAVLSGDMLIVAGYEELLLLSRAGDLIERQAWNQSKNGAIESIGLINDSGVVVRTTKALWVADAQLLNWQSYEELEEIPVWSIAVNTPPALQQGIENKYRGDGLSLERLLLDLHSGRVFGTIGIVVYDLLALALGFLAVSGLILWVRGRRNGKRSE